MLIGFLATVSAASAATLAVSAAQADAPAVRDRADIERIVHDYILEHPEILPQAMERLQAKRIAATIDEHRPEIETPYANAAWEGAKDADVVVVEFFDYACSFCRASLPDLAKLLKSDPRVKIVYRELPGHPRARAHGGKQTRLDPEFRSLARAAAQRLDPESKAQSPAQRVKEFALVGPDIDHANIASQPAQADLDAPALKQSICQSHLLLPNRGFSLGPSDT